MRLVRRIAVAALLLAALGMGVVTRDGMLVASLILAAVAIWP